MPPSLHSPPCHTYAWAGTPALAQLAHAPLGAGAVYSATPRHQRHCDAPPLSLQA